MRCDNKRLCSLRDGNLLAAAMGRCIAAENAMYVSEQSLLQYKGYDVETISCHCRHMFDVHATLAQGSCSCCVSAAG